jgi:ribosomal protein S4
MSMSKWTLYKLTRLTTPPYKLLNLYQQKWKSKSMMRHYHGEKVPEKQWERIFMRNKRLRAVVPMNPQYLAANDGTNESSGRGAGLGEREERRVAERTPYMNMTFAGLERRLDVAVFRALFASSARQARQFVVHGSVKVNGVTVSHALTLWMEGRKLIMLV